MLRWLRSYFAVGNWGNYGEIIQTGVPMAAIPPAPVKDRGEAQSVSKVTTGKEVAKAKLCWLAGIGYQAFPLYSTNGSRIYRGIPQDNNTTGAEASQSKDGMQRPSPIDLECW